MRFWKTFRSSSFRKPKPKTAPDSDALSCTNFADVQAIIDSPLIFILKRNLFKLKTFYFHHHVRDNLFDLAIYYYVSLLEHHQVISLRNFLESDFSILGEKLVQLL